ncbi:MAG TPA: hypothetical protein VF729_09475, partial [Solirubrobacterales bacterium]
GSSSMPTQAKSSSTSSSKSTKTQSKAPKKSTPVTASRSAQARSLAESALDLPVGAVLELGDRVAELVEPLSGRAEAEKQLQAYRTRLRRTVKRTERRGTTARRKAAAEARKTRSRVEREARKRRSSLETQIKRNRDQVEEQVRRVGDQLSALR